MAQTYSRLRQQAEIAFQRTQVTADAVIKHLVKNDSEADRLRAKTARLRKARLGRDSVRDESDRSELR